MKRVLSILAQFGIGLGFGLGLVISGMSNPAKVLNFLDLGAIPTGGWDPSLAFVMVGAIAVTFTGYRLVLRHPKPLFGAKFHLPSATDVDARVVVGPAIFGVGWGLAGFCPGPAFTALGTGGTASLLFVVAMLAGMAGARRLGSRPATLAQAGPRN
jgi:uncharacterized membrane protein YedE/YeeE